MSNMSERAKDLVELFKDREPLPVEHQIAIEFLEKERELVLDEIERLREALKEVAKCEGEFSLDHHRHCLNTVDNMKSIAKAALTESQERGE